MASSLLFKVQSAAWVTSINTECAALKLRPETLNPPELQAPNLLKRSDCCAPQRVLCRAEGLGPLQTQQRDTASNRTVIHQFIQQVLAYIPRFQGSPVLSKTQNSFMQKKRYTEPMPETGPRASKTTKPETLKLKAKMSSLTLTLDTHILTLGPQILKPTSPELCIMSLCGVI